MQVGDTWDYYPVSITAELFPPTNSFSLSQTGGIGTTQGTVCPSSFRTNCHHPNCNCLYRPAIRNSQCPALLLLDPKCFLLLCSFVSLWSSGHHLEDPTSKTLSTRYKTEILETEKKKNTPSMWVFQSKCHKMMVDFQQVAEKIQLWYIGLKKNVETNVATQPTQPTI